MSVWKSVSKSVWRGGQKPTFSQSLELGALRYPKREKNAGEKFLEKIFGPGDPVTGIIWANPLPADYKPTPELEEIVYVLKNSTQQFVEMQVSLATPDGYRYATYEGSGNHLDQWVRRHTGYILHHSKHLYGTTVTAVFALDGLLPEHDENDRQIGGITKEQYEKGLLR